MRRGNVVCKRAKKFAGIGASNEWLQKCSTLNTRGQKTKKNYPKQTWMQLSVGDRRRGGNAVCKRVRNYRGQLGPDEWLLQRSTPMQWEAHAKEQRNCIQLGPGWMASAPNTKHQKSKETAEAWTIQTGALSLHRSPIVRGTQIAPYGNKYLQTIYIYMLQIIRLA